MKSQVEKTKLAVAKFPDTPGVYKFLRGKKVLYIGKATSLRDRVRSYFNQDILNTRGPLIYKMLENFDKVEFIKTDSVLEALILEAELIKKYQPEANTIDKDDKSFNHVVITKENFPRVLTVRGRELQQFIKTTPIKDSFGPFTNGSQLREALRIIRKMFPYRDKCLPCVALAKRGVLCKPCFNRQIGLCPGVCTGEITKVEYAKQISNIILFFEGKKKQLLRNLEKQMKSFADNHEFEKANITKHTLFALNHIKDVSLIKPDLRHGVDDKVFRIESYDIAHMSGQNVVGVMIVVENGEVKKSDYRKFKIKDNPGVNDTKALAEILERRLTHIEWRLPDLIVVDGGVAQRNIAEKIIEKSGLKIPVVSVVKDDRHKPKEILGDPSSRAKLATGQVGGRNEIERQILLSNSEAHRFAIGFHKQLRGRLI